MFRIILCLFMFIFHYLEFLWKSFEKPILYFIIRQCPHQSRNNIRSFFVEQYQKLLAFIFNTQQHDECHLYKVNLHLDILFFIFKSSSIIYSLLLLLRMFKWFYAKQSQYILQKQIKPFIHIRSVARINQQSSIV